MSIVRTPFAFWRAQNAAGWATQASGLDRLVYGFERLVSFRGVLAGDIMVTDFAHVLTIAWAVPAAIASWRILGPAYSIWSLSIIVPALGIWIGFGRYVLPVFPLFVATSVLLRRPHAFLAWIFVSSLLLALFTVMYGLFYWVA